MLPRRDLRAGLLVALALPCACGPGPSEAADDAARAGAGAVSRSADDAGRPLDEAQRRARGLPPQQARGDDPRLRAATEALERLDVSAATRELLALDGGFDAELLRVRLSALEGDGIGAVRRLEALRADHADQARLYATAAEVHALAGRLGSAEEAIREGLERCGPTPELSRARGVLALAREGGARVGLNHLLEAREVDPELPFLARPLCQAHLLLGRQAMADGALVDAIGHARAARLALPGESEARLLLADALSASGELDEALALYEGLLADGEGVRDTLAQACKQGATAALVEGRREVAVDRYLRARELGLPGSELGFGASLLAEASAQAFEAGAAALQAGDLAGARERFARAVSLDPLSLAARNYLAVVQFKLGDYADAAAQWRAVLDQARAEGLELPEPVHVQLAGALVLDGRPDEARALLAEELARDPDGPGAEKARELLQRLEHGPAGADEGGR
jgi:predicted Zn-dependent protease